MDIKELSCLGIGMILLVMAIFYFLGEPTTTAQNKPESLCKIYYDKAKELAEKSIEELPQGQTIGFDPRIAKANSSIAYSQIYKNCRVYGE